MKNKSPSILQIILISIIAIITFGGFLWNCTFSMDTTKYPNRTTCAISQYQEAATYVITKYTDYLQARMERKIERQQEALSGALLNFSGGIKAQ